MARPNKREILAEAFRLRVMELRSMPDADWNDWEADWLDSQARRPSDYLPSEKERMILNQLLASVKTFEGYNGWTVKELLVMGQRYIADLDEGSQEFVRGLVARQSMVLRVRQINQLSDICRMTEDIGRDEDVDEVMREVRRRDDSADEWSKVA